MRLRRTSLLALAVATPLLAAEERVPLLVTVDDLPIAGGGLHDGPEERERITRGLLAALEEFRVPAVGLVTWGNVKAPRDLELLDRWLAAGLELGHHSFRHLDLHRVDAATWLDDVERGRRELAAYLAARESGPPRFFRFPMLREGDTEAKLDAARAWLAETGQRSLPVSLDNQDWSHDRPFTAALREGDEAGLRRVADGYHESLHLSVRHHRRTSDRLFGRPVAQILLLHANAIGAAEWPRLFAWLEREGYRFASADEVLADPAYAEAPRYLGPRGPGLWDRLLDLRRRAEAEAAVRALLARQVETWNRGDLEEFASAYAAEALFVSPSGVTRGSGPVLERYRDRYSDAREMGRLTLAVEEVRLTAGGEVSMLGDARPGEVHGARVLATWTLERPDLPDARPRSGPTLIVLERRGGAWRIVEDASMEAPQGGP